MSNKKSINNKKVSNKENSKKIESVGGLDGDITYIVRVVSIIIIIFCLFYGLTVILTKNGNTTTNKKNNTIVESDISYSEILLGRSFEMPEEEYLVLFYDKSDTDLLSSFSSTVSDYNKDEDHYTLYTVDMSNKFNSKYSSDNSNTNPSNASELSINGPTLIHISNGEVVRYIEGVDNIINYMQ